MNQVTTKNTDSNTEEVIDPYGTSWFLTDNTIHFRGKTGLGDALLGLNASYYCSHFLEKKVKLKYYWTHGEEKLFHPEDPEPLIWQQEYIHKFYHKYGLIDFETVLHDDHSRFEGMLHTGLEKKQGYRVLDGVNSWSFSKEVVEQKRYNNLVVIWRPQFLEGKFKSFKNSYDEHYWSYIVPLLRQHWHVEEVTYRTPIKEVMHLLSRCTFVVAYNGMYHYLTKNMFTPMIVMGDSSIIKMHNPQAIWWRHPSKDKSEREILDYIMNIKSKNLKKMQRKAQSAKTKIMSVIC